MPLYEYVCENKHKLVEIRSIHDDNEPTVCPDCGLKLAQVIAGVSVSFKGSGFYSTDRNKQ
jgi:putative FmdB family regulatory protein